MTAPVISFDDDDINAAATGLDAQAEALEEAAVKAEEAIPTIEANSSTFKDTYEPDGIHKSKVGDLTDLLKSRSADARNTANTLRTMAQKMRDHVVTNAEVQAQSAANVDDIDTEGVTDA